MIRTFTVINGIKDEWNCSRGSDEKSICVGGCNGQSSVKRCQCNDGHCDWKTKGQELKCSKKVRRKPNSESSVKQLLAPALEAIKKMSPMDRKLVAQSLKSELGLTSPIERVEKVPLEGDPTEALLITSSSTVLSENLADIKDCCLSIVYYHKWLDCKTTNKENWVDFLVQLASFDRLTLISIDNGVMKD